MSCLAKAYVQFMSHWQLDISRFVTVIVNVTAFLEPISRPTFLPSRVFLPGLQKVSEPTEHCTHCTTRFGFVKLNKTMTALRFADLPCESATWFFWILLHWFYSLWCHVSPISMQLTLLPVRRDCPISWARLESKCARGKLEHTPVWKKIGPRPKDSGNKMSVIFLFLLCLGLCVPQLSYIAQVQVFTFDATVCFLNKTDLTMTTHM